MNYIQERDALRRSRCLYIGENAVASVIFSLGTGNFLAGLLSWMGAGPSWCAVIAAMPQLGCLFQLVSPFLFERLARRKRCIIACCFAFRFSLGLAGLVPILLAGQEQRIPLVFWCYLAAFSIAGFVTPGLNQWMLDLAPARGRGSFFARRDIVSSLVSAGVLFWMGRQLDACIRAGHSREGYLLVFCTVACLSLLDAVMMTMIQEPALPQPIHLSMKDLATPLREKNFRAIVVLLSLWAFAQNFSVSFLSVYQLSELHLSHGSISAMTVAASALGIFMSGVWGRAADRLGWKNVLLTGGGLLCAAYLGWWALAPQWAVFLAPPLMCLTTAGTGAYSLSSLNLQYIASPGRGRTAYFGVTAAISNITGYLATLLAAWVRPVCAELFGRSGIPFLFLCSAVAFGVCVLYGGRTVKNIFDTSA